MKLLFPCVKVEDHFSVSSLIANVIAALGRSGVEVVYKAYSEELELENTLGAIVEVVDEKNYIHTLDFIRNIYRKLPYLCIVRAEDDSFLEEVKKLEPAVLLVAPETEREVESEVKSFLMKVMPVLPHNAEHGHGLDSDNYIWLSLKKGVYEKLNFKTIKYIESINRHLKIHCDHTSLPAIKATLKGFYDQHLESRGNFYVLNRSCIINLSKVKKIEKNQLFIDSHKPLSIPKARKEEVLESIGI